FYQYIVSDCGDSAFCTPSIPSIRKNLRSAISKSGIRFCRTNVFVCPEIVLQNIEIAHDLIAKRSHPRVTPEDVLWRIRRKRLSTLKIRVKRRLSIWCHRPAVSFSCEASVVCLTGPKGRSQCVALSFSLPPERHPCCHRRRLPRTWR